MGKLLALFVLAIMLVVVEIASLFWDYHETAWIARKRASGAPPPMLDEPGGVPTYVAPSENGTNRVYVLGKSVLTGRQFRGRPLSR